MDDATTSRSALALAGAGSRALTGLHTGLLEVRHSWRVILQATVATALAYAAGLAIGHENPFFAPIAALATVAISLAQRLRRATELVVGNAIGILGADLLIAQIGTGAWQLGLAVAIALTTALLAGGGPILIMQSSSAAILIATLTPPTADQPWNTGRFVDALIGGGIGLVVSALLLPVDPARHARASTDPVLVTLADGYRRVGAALTARERAAADRVLTDLRGTAPVLARFHSGLDATRESVRLAPWYWGQRTLLTSYALAGFHLDNALRNLRVLARQAEVALDRGEAVPAQIPAALEGLGSACDALGAVLAGEADPTGVRRTLIGAVALTVGLIGPVEPGAPEGAEPAPGADPAAAPEPGLELSVGSELGSGSALFTAPMVGQIRLSASDLLQASGMSSAEAATVLRAVGDPQR